MTGQLVLLDVADDGVATITFNRPERNNGWTPDLEAAYWSALRAVDEDERVRAVVVTGAGRSFCPGADSQRLTGLSGAQLDFSERMPPTAPLRVRKPVIAAVNGACAGIGLVHALMCDVRFVSRSAKIAVAFPRRGLSAESGIAYLLPRMIGIEKALDLLLSGRVFDGEEAVRLGLALRACDAEEVVSAARDYARELATWSSPYGMALAKRQVWSGLDLGLEESVASAQLAQVAAAAGPDLPEGIASFVERRPPAFASLSRDLRPDDILFGDANNDRNS